MLAVCGAFSDHFVPSFLVDLDLLHTLLLTFGGCLSLLSLWDSFGFLEFAFIVPLQHSLGVFLEHTLLFLFLVLRVKPW